MSYKIVTARLTASPSSLGWAQVHEFAPQDTEKLKLRGHLYAVISTRNASEKKGEGQTIDSVNAGREMLGRLHEEYFGKTIGTSFDVLKSAISKIVEEFRNTQSEVEVAAVANVSGIIYTAATGGAQLAIFRNGSLANILVSRGSEVVIASGYPKEGDILTLGTSAFFKKFSDGVIRGALEGKNIQRAAESFAPSIHASNVNPDLGVSFLEFKKSEKEETSIKDIGIKDVSSESLTLKGDGATKKEVFPKEVDSKSQTSPVSSKQRYNKWDVLRKIKQIINIRGRSVYVRETEEPLESKKRRKVSASVGVILVIVLVVSVFFGIQQKSDRDYRSEYDSELTEAQHLLEESLSLYTIDTGRSREFFNQARNIVDGLLASGIEDEELDGVDAKIKEKQGEILGEYKAQLENFSDLTIITSGFLGKSIIGYGEEIYVLDNGGERIVSISSAARKSRVVVGPAQLSGVSDFAIYNDRTFVINDEGIFEVSKTLKDEVAKKDWSGEATLFAYTSNLYLLEKDASDISRYVSTESGFADRKSWMSEGLDTNFSKVVDWVIDGTIWLLREDGGILRFSQGNKLSFSIKGLAPELVGGTAIYTNEDIENIYVLDSQGKRVVVIDKDGNFKAQYIAQEISGAKDIFVSESEGKIILLKDGKLLSTAIRHQ